MKDLKILGIDTSGHVAAVAVCDDENCLGQSSVVTKLTHSQVIMPMMERVLKDCNLTLKDIDAFAVADGPGSYTGLRIGISAVKAVAYSLEKKCFGISTLMSLAYNCVASQSRIVSVMKARPGIVYFACFKSDGNKLERLCDDKICTEDEAVEYLMASDEDTVITGDIAVEFFDKCKEINYVRLAPCELRLQSAVSLCMAAKNMHESVSPEMLNVSYLQITKAEKELIEKENR